MLVPASEIERRVARVQAGLRADGLDAALVVELTDVFYLTGTTCDGHLVVPADGEPVLLVRRDPGRARAESPLAHVEPLRSLRALPDAVRAAVGAPLERLGLEVDVLPAAAYLRYGQLLPGVALADAAPAIHAARSVKSPWEIERAAASGAVLAGVVREAEALVVDGATDLGVQIACETRLRERGHQGPCRFRGMNGEVYFGAILAGPDAALPAYSDTPLGGPGPNPMVGRGAGGARIGPGVPVTVDLICSLEGWMADMTRTYAVDALPAPLDRALATCEAILREVEGLLVPGTPWRLPYERGLELATEAGFGDGYMGAGPTRVRFLGHGVGLEMNERPFLAAGFDEPLEAGMVIAVEPKIVLPGVGAVGIENTYAVAAEGPPQLLTRPA